MASKGGDKSQKTEQPSGRKKAEARRQGQIPRSPELASWVMLLALTAALPLVTRLVGTRLMQLEALGSEVMARPTTAGALRLLGSGLGDFALLFLPIGGMVLAIVLVVNIAQVGFVLAVKKLMPDLKKLSPAQGLKRLVSPAHMWEMGKQVLKLALVGVLAVRFLLGVGHAVIGARPVALGALIGFAGSSLLGFLREICVLALVIAAADYLVQRRQHRKSLMMTKEEKKEETRSEMGDPKLRGQIRSRQMKMSRLRMMAAVAKADVVVVNPTHVAVALRYERGSERAPKVVAKGGDELAARIREEAQRHRVPVVEDAPLARAIFGACALDAEIPPELYLAVARLLAFVYKLPGVERTYRALHRPPRSALFG